MIFFFFLMIRRTPRSTRTDTLFPYTTLFRSQEFCALWIEPYRAVMSGGDIRPFMNAFPSMIKLYQPYQHPRIASVSMVLLPNMLRWTSQGRIILKIGRAHV